jgi:regulation of enolase protein 1 (concanavalin A-like superfamily)
MISKTLCVTTMVVGLMTAAAASLRAGDADADDPTLLFHETFRAPKLSDGWTWLREDPKHWRLGEHGLEVHIQPGNMWGPDNDAKNVLLRPVPGDPQKQTIEVTASVFNHPTNQWEQVDLVWYYDDGHMVKVGEELVDGKLSVVMGREENDRTRTISITPLDSEHVTLRYRVKGNKIQGSFKTPKADWRDVGECDLPAPAKADPRISLQFYRGPADAEHWAQVSELTVRGI